jgi:polyphosphate kinase 2
MSEPEEIAMAKSKGKKTAKTSDRAGAAPAVGTGIVARPPFWAGREAEKMSKKDYEAELARLEIELVKLQGWIREKGLKVAVIFEGRDSAGKGGVIKRITYRMSPRVARVVALQAPTEKEKSQWYFQRYVPHLPSAGEMVLFDRSWYNRAGVERVMGFCTDDQYDEFMATVNGFEAALVSSGTILIKYWLDIADETQEERFDERIIDPRKRWKLSPMDLFARSKWVDYSRARDVMLAHTDTEHAPWWIVDGNIKRHARLNTITHLLSQVPYKDLTPKKLKLPRRQKAGGYQPPDYSKAHFVPTVWPKDD